MQPALTRSRRVPFILRCIAAAPAGCRGTVRLRDEEGAAASSPVRFRIPVGRRRRIVARVTPRAYRAALREGREGIGGSFFVVEATAVDPAGRRSVLSDGYGVLVP
jgi:hypothetical protein